MNVWQLCSTSLLTSLLQIYGETVSGVPERVQNVVQNKMSDTVDAHSLQALTVSSVGFHFLMQLSTKCA